MMKRDKTKLPVHTVVTPAGVVPTTCTVLANHKFEVIETVATEMAEAESDLDEHTNVASEGLTTDDHLPHAHSIDVSAEQNKPNRPHQNEKIDHLVAHYPWSHLPTAGHGRA